MMRERVQLIAVLGGKCVQCGIDDIEMLQLDHIHDDGLQDSGRFANHLPAMYRFYLKNLDQAKERLQVLCANHNWKKRYSVTRLNKPHQPRKVSSRAKCEGCGDWVYYRPPDAVPCTNCGIMNEYE